MCGVVGILHPTRSSVGAAPHSTLPAAQETFLALTTLQHRGQDAAGILTYDADGFHRVKDVGLVESVFTRENMSVLTGPMALGHARYATVGRGDTSDVQPFLLNYPFGIGLVHNGNLINVRELAAELKQKHRRSLLTTSDTEVLHNWFAQALASSPEGEDFFESLCRAVGQVFERVNGSYSIVAMIADRGLVAFRDPSGIRPLVWGSRRGDGAQIFASESVSLPFLQKDGEGYELERDVHPGEVIFVDLQGTVHSRVLESARKRPHRPCMFEWVYFASPESVADGVPVYAARIELGRALARDVRTELSRRGFEADVIVPVPETSRIAAIALAEELKVPYREVLIKNRYIKRTFILDSQEKRQQAVNLKLSPVRSEIQGKRVLLVDDSIVRGTTSRKIIDLVRGAGARQVFFVSTCPPIQHPCFYGIDFPVESELIASGRTGAEIEKELGADAVIYQSAEGLRRSLANARIAGAGESFRPCMACLDGDYPTDAAAGRELAARRSRDRVPAAGGKAVS